MDNFIRIFGARENNLKNINLEIPRDKLVVFTGLSGSGKSSLAFDTIFAEGQRRYMESLSSYARQFLGQMKKPDVDRIDGLSPAIAIDQKSTSSNPRSTVGTVTEIYDYFRLLFASIGTPYCVNCGIPINASTIDAIASRVMACENGSKLMIISPVISRKTGEYKDLFEDFRKKGYLRVKVDGKIYTLDEDIELDKKKKHDISVVIDRLIRTDNMDGRLIDSLETAVKLSGGLVVVDTNGEEVLYSTKHSCPNCGFSFNEISSRLFSFNTPIGACPECMGLGSKMVIEENLLVKDWNLSLDEGAISAFGWGDYGFGQMFFAAVKNKFNIKKSTPLKDFPREVLDFMFYGTQGEKIKIQTQNNEFNMRFEGIIPNLYRRHENGGDFTKNEIEKYMVNKPCEACHGKRLNSQALAVKIAGKNIIDVCDMNVNKIYDFITNLKLTEKEQKISQSITKEILARIKFLIDVGLDYLTLSRTASTLSGGEAQRIRLATQIGSGLVGVLYILDEPSIGLHPRDTQRLIMSLKRLRDLGNTLIVVEHDEEMMRSSDWIVDVGPKAGVHGGRIVASGTPNEIMDNVNSITGAYLSGRKQIEIPKTRRPFDKSRMLEIIGARQNNLKNVNVQIPLGNFVAVTGVSGSGKSSLVNEILYPAVANKVNKLSRLTEGDYDEIRGTENLDKVVVIDQSPIGRTPRSNPVTYTGVFTPIRELFASLPDAKAKGYDAGRFSFNVKGGRCEACGGDGVIKIEMHFLPDVYVTCDECKGKRYNKNTLEVKYKGKTISDVLDMTIEDALEFFYNIPTIKNKLQTLVDVGLGYITLGQSATTLSGGEAQRVKLATELSKRATGKTLYILDEPTTGLHTHDVEKLIAILQRLVSSGNSVVVIEHNLDLIKVADYIIDIGPEGGERGGNIIAVGSPEEIAKNTNSYTGKFLQKILK